MLSFWRAQGGESIGPILRDLVDRSDHMKGSRIGSEVEKGHYFRHGGSISLGTTPDRFEFSITALKPRLRSSSYR